MAQPSVSRKTLPLSRRELEVLKLLVEGYNNVEIAANLHVSCNTIKTHIRNILEKFGVDNRIQAAVFAVRAGLL
jgi:DNA-binding NarL/FixJ family response regulator